MAILKIRLQSMDILDNEGRVRTSIASTLQRACMRPRVCMSIRIFIRACIYEGWQEVKLRLRGCRVDMAESRRRGRGR